QGAFGALLAPSALAIVTATFANSPARGRAFAIFGAVAGIAGAFGLLLGGLLTEYLNWRWTLYVNLAFAAIGLIGAAAFLRGGDRPAHRPKRDLPATPPPNARLARPRAGCRRAVPSRLRAVPGRGRRVERARVLAVPDRRSRVARRVHRLAGPGGRAAAAAAGARRPRPRCLDHRADPGQRRDLLGV